MEEFTNWLKAESTGHYFFYAFPFAIVLLLIVLKKGKRLRFVLPAILITLIIVNPGFYNIWDRLGMYAYWRLLWIVPVIPMLASVVPGLTEKIRKPWIKVAATASGITLIILGGAFLYNGAAGSFIAAVNVEKLPEDVIQIADRLLEHDTNPRIIAQDPVGVYIRQYTGDITTLYGRDVHAYIVPVEEKAMAVHNELNNGDMEPVAQFMLDEGYDYLIYNGDAGECFELISRAGGYGIYRASE